MVKKDTIKDRADDCLRDIWNSNWEDVIFADFRDKLFPYVHTAMLRQRSIDIGRAMKWIRVNIYPDKDDFDGTMLDMLEDFEETMKKE